MAHVRRAAAYLRIASEDGSLHAFYLAYRRMGIRAHRLMGGRGLRFHQAALDAALETARVEPLDDEESLMTWRRRRRDCFSREDT